jgi:hypothetical protein
VAAVSLLISPAILAIPYNKVGYATVSHCICV